MVDEEVPKVVVGVVAELLNEVVAKLVDEIVSEVVVGLEVESRYSGLSAICLVECAFRSVVGSMEKVVVSNTDAVVASDIVVWIRTFSYSDETSSTSLRKCVSPMI